MPFIAVPVDLPPHVVELRSGDVDADGVPDLVAVERRKNGHEPDSVALTTFHMTTGGAVKDRWRVDLKTTPLLIDIHDGLWAVSPDGVSAITRDGIQTVVAAPSPVDGLGPTTPVFADLFVDLEDDGVPEAVLASGQSVRIVSTDGRERASVRAQGRGELEVRMRGGTQVVSSAVSPRWHLDDFNGDGIQDLLLPRGRTLQVYPITGDGVGARQDIPLPIDVTPREREGSRKKGETRKRVISVWMKDLDGDGRTDFAAQLWITEGSWMGAEGELLFARGTGTGFGELQRMRSEQAVLLVRVADIDNDGDMEMASAEVDFGVGNLTRAMLTQKIKVDVMYREMDGGRYRPAAALHEVVVPVGNDRDPPVEMESDLTGDGIPDLVTSQDSESVYVFAGTGDGFASDPTAVIDVGFRQGEHKLWVGDLTGDGRAEVVVWKLRTSAARVLMLKP